MLTRPRSSERMQYFGAHAGINALKLLANQQEDGDGLVQNIVTSLGKESLREFIHIYNHRALEEGHLSEGLGSFRVRRPKGQGGYPEVTVRESSNE